MLVAVGCELVEMAKTYCYKNITTEKLNNISCHVVSRDWVCASGQLHVLPILCNQVILLMSNRLS